MLGVPQGFGSQAGWELRSCDAWNRALSVLSCSRLVARLGGDPPDPPFGKVRHTWIYPQNPRDLRAGPHPQVERGRGSRPQAGRPVPGPVAQFGPSWLPPCSSEGGGSLRAGEGLHYHCGDCTGVGSSQPFQGTLALILK